MHINETVTPLTLMECGYKGDNTGFTHTHKSPSLVLNSPNYFAGRGLESNSQPLTFSKTLEPNRGTPFLPVNERTNELYRLKPTGSFPATSFTRKQQKLLSSLLSPESGCILVLSPLLDGMAVVAGTFCKPELEPHIC